MSHYDVLELKPSASADEVKAAFKKLARLHHPDKNQFEDRSDSECRFKELSNAYSVLSDPRSRQEYDASLGERRTEEKKKDPNVVLFEAARDGDVFAMKQAIKRGARVQWRNTSADGRTALHAAAAAGRTEAINALAVLGADPKAFNLYRDTALHESSMNGHEQASKLLVAMGSDVKMRNKFDASPLHCAAAEGRIRVASLLVGLGAEVAGVNAYGMTAGQLAHFRGHHCLGTFLEHCADKNGRCKCEDCWRLVIGIEALHLSDQELSDPACPHWDSVACFWNRQSSTDRQAYIAEKTMADLVHGMQGPSRFDDEILEGKQSAEGEAVAIPYPINGVQRKSKILAAASTENSRHGGDPQGSSRCPANQSLPGWFRYLTVSNEPDSKAGAGAEKAAPPPGEFEAM